MMLGQFSLARIVENPLIVFTDSSLSQPILSPSTSAPFSPSSSSSSSASSSAPRQSESDGNTSDEDQSEEEHVVPEVLCNLRDVEVPIDNDILFEVDENDAIRVSASGSCPDVNSGDILVSINGRFLKSYSEGHSILLEETTNLHSKKSLQLRLLTNSSEQEIEREQKKSDELIRQKNSIYYATNFYSLAQQAYRKHHYPLSLQYVQKAYSIAKSMCSSLSPSPSSLPPLPRSHQHSSLYRLEKLLACCRELEGDIEIALGKDIHAIELFQEAVTIRTRVYSNPYHLSLYKLYDTLSRIYRHHSIFTQSLEYAQHLIRICQENSLQHSARMANALSNLAKIKRDQHLLNDSFLLEIESFQLRVMIYGYNHESIALSLLAIGQIKLSLEDYGQGTEEIYLKSLNIYQTLKNSSIPSRGYCNEIGDVYRCLSSLYTYRNDHLKGKEMKAEEISSRQKGGLITKGLVHSLWEMSLLVEHTEPNVASEYRVKAISGMRRLYGEDSKKLKKLIKEHEKKL